MRWINPLGAESGVRHDIGLTAVEQRDAAQASIIADEVDAASLPDLRQQLGKPMLDVDDLRGRVFAAPTYWPPLVGAGTGGTRG